MRFPDILTTLLDHGIIDEILRPLMSGKEAQIYLVSVGGAERVAKIYKDAQNRSFQNRADYTEGRKVRNTRDQRAMNNRSRHGRAQNESAWKTAEVDMIYRLRSAGVRVPTPFHFIDDVLIMELVSDAEGHPAPRLGDLTFEPEQATQIFHQVLGEVVRMLCAGVVHGDLSDFNVLMAADGPVIIDFPQAVDASSNQNARKLLLRDVDNLHRFHAKFAPLVPALPYAQEIWDLYQRNALTPDTRLTGKFRVSQKAVRTDDVLSLIAEAEREEQRRREGLARALRPHLYTKSGGARPSDGRGGPAPQRAGERPQGQVAQQARRPPQDGRANPPRDARPQQARDGRSNQAHDGRPTQGRDGRPTHARDERSNQARDGRSTHARDGRSNQARDGRSTHARDERSNQARDGRSLHARDGRSAEGNRAATPRAPASQDVSPRDAHASSRPRQQASRGHRGLTIVEQAMRDEQASRQDVAPQPQGQRGDERSRGTGGSHGGDGASNERRERRGTFRDRGDGSR